MRILAMSSLVLVLSSACAKFEPEEKPAPEPAAEEKVEAAKQEPAPPPAKVAAVAAPDCGPLLTSEDIQSVCKNKFALTVGSADPTRPDRCTVRGGGGGKRMYFEAVSHPSEDAAAAASKGVAAGQTKIEEAGDKSMQSQTVYTRKGATSLSLSNQLMGGQKGVCSTKQLAALLMLAHGRLP